MGRVRGDQGRARSLHHHGMGRVQEAGLPTHLRQHAETRFHLRRAQRTGRGSASQDRLRRVLHRQTS